MASEATPQTPSAVEEQMKELRMRKVYIQLRIPRIKAEVAALAARKKAINGSGEDLSQERIQELIYGNQHLLALRKEIESLEQERKTILRSFKDLRTQADKSAPRREVQ